MKKLFYTLPFASILLLTYGTVFANGLPGTETDECEKQGLAASSFKSDSALDYPVGVFDGTWEGKLEHTFVLLEAQDNRIAGMYAWGKYGLWGILEPGCGKVTGEIQSGTKIRLDRLSNGAVVRYTFIDEDTIEGTYFQFGRSYRGVFKRVYTPGPDGTNLFTAE